LAELFAPKLTRPDWRHESSFPVDPSGLFSYKVASTDVVRGRCWNDRLPELLVLPAPSARVALSPISGSDSSLTTGSPSKLPREESC
jgi:hypothetical protein